MLSPANRKQTHLVNYEEDYLDSIYCLSLNLKRNVSVMQEIEAKCQEILKELEKNYEKNYEKFKRETDGAQKSRIPLHPESRDLEPGAGQQEDSDPESAGGACRVPDQTSGQSRGTLGGTSRDQGHHWQQLQSWPREGKEQDSCTGRKAKLQVFPVATQQCESSDEYI
ncbi:Inhibitor of growth protein 1 [Sciurus carolinensis]|uniref:Inhibitor of growth protein 1 n=1 Tax=Sciurus carolinensis TaxID=30640 RepID=A0AA41NLD6_SCICA|nr:Inhibitor of growth protein 1 [Sciurus carolinensis]